MSWAAGSWNKNFQVWSFGGALQGLGSLPSGGVDSAQLDRPGFNVSPSLLDDSSF